MAEYQVIDKTAHDAELRSIGDSIRAKGGTTAPFNSAAEMKAAIEAIQAGGGGGIPGITESEIVCDREIANGEQFAAWMETISTAMICNLIDQKYFNNQTIPENNGFVYAVRFAKGDVNTVYGAPGIVVRWRGGAPMTIPWGYANYDVKLHVGDVLKMFEVNTL